MERRLSTTSDSSTDSRQSICDGLEGVANRIAKSTSPKVAVNPLQFVKVGPCDLYRSAQEQLKKVEEIKKAKKEQKDDIEDWQSNLDNWKCSRRKRQEHIIERVVEVKKFELEEQERNKRRSKTFNEMMQERSTRGRKASLPIYHNDEQEDLSDLGISCKKNESHDLPPVDNNVTNGIQEVNQASITPIKTSFDTTNFETIKHNNRQSTTSTDNSNTVAQAQQEYTYERAIQSYVNFTETRVKSRSLKEINDNLLKANSSDEEKNLKMSPPIPAKPSFINANNCLNKNDNAEHINNNTSTAIKIETNAAAKKLILPKVDVNRRRELFEKIQDTEEINGRTMKNVQPEVPTTRSIKERLSSLERQDSTESQKSLKCTSNSISCEKLVKERLQNIEIMAATKLAANSNKKFNEIIPSVSLKDRLSNFVKTENNSTKKQPVIESSVSIKERLNNLQTSINKEPTRTVVINSNTNFNEKLATFREGSTSKSELLYDSSQPRKCNNFDDRSFSPSSDVCNSNGNTSNTNVVGNNSTTNRRHFRHRSLDSLDVEHDSIVANVSFERVQSLEDLDYCRNYPPSTFSGDTDREDSGIHTADVSSSVSQADDYDLHLLTNTLEEIKINHQPNDDVNNKHHYPQTHQHHRLPDGLSTSCRCDDYEKHEDGINHVSSTNYSPTLDTKLHLLVEESSITFSNTNKCSSLSSDTFTSSQALPSIPECTTEQSLFNTTITITSPTTATNLLNTIPVDSTSDVNNLSTRNDVNLENDKSYTSYNNNSQQIPNNNNNNNKNNINYISEHSSNLSTITSNSEIIDDANVNKMMDDQVTTALNNHNNPFLHIDEQNCTNIYKEINEDNLIDLSNDNNNAATNEQTAMGNNTINNTYLDFSNANQYSSDLLLLSDVSTNVNTNEKFDEPKSDNNSLTTTNSDVAINPIEEIMCNPQISEEFIANEIAQEELQNKLIIKIINDQPEKNSPNDVVCDEYKLNILTNQSMISTDNYVDEELGTNGGFIPNGCLNSKLHQVDGLLLNMSLKDDNNCVFSLSPAVLEPPKEKPPPPPIENSDEEAETKPSKMTSLWRADSTKRIKKEIRQKRSSFLGIEGSSDDSYLEPELELIKPPDMSALLAEERRIERQLYRQSVCSESDSNQESRDSGVELDHKHQDVWIHSRNDSETYGNQSTTSDEDEIMKKEREIIETLEKEEKIRKQDLGEKLAMRLRELEAEKERIEWEQLNKENGRTHLTTNIYPEENIHISKEFTKEAVPTIDDRIRYDTTNYQLTAGGGNGINGDGMNGIQSDWYDQRSSLQDITQKEVADINGGIFHDEQQYRLECRKSLQDLSRVISGGGNHVQKSKQNLFHRRSMPNLQESAPPITTITPSATTAARRPPPPPPVLLPASRLNHANINNINNHQCNNQQMTKQALHALSAAPRSRLISTETWQAKRKQKPDNYNYQHWLIQEAEHRRITEQQQRQTAAARRPIPSQHAYITPTSKLAASNQQQQYPSVGQQWTTAKNHHAVSSSLYNTHPPWTNQNQRNHHSQQQKNKPLPDSIIQTLTQRVQHKMHPDSNNNRRRKELIMNELPHPPLQNDSAKDKMLSVSGKKRCSHCGEELGRGAAMIIESLQLFYHIDCFKCCVCCLQLGDGLMGTDVRVRNNKLHCHNCYSSDDGAKFSCV